MKRLRAKIESCGFSFSKQMVIYLLVSLSFFLAAGAFYFYRRQPHIFLYPVLLLLLFTFFYFSRYDGILKRNEEKDEIEFVALFTYFSIYIKDGFNVYNALEQIVPYASERIQERLKKLLAQIESDKTLQPYLDFAAPFHSLSVKEDTTRYFAPRIDEISMDRSTHQSLPASPGAWAWVYGMPTLSAWARRVFPHSM